MVLINHLDDLIFFAQIVQSGNLTQAAKVLGVPKSRVSRRLQKLEEQVAAPLLYRSTRKIELTEIGQLLYQRSLPHIEALATVQDDVHTALNKPTGNLRLLFPTEFFNPVVSELIVDFSRQYSDITLNVEQYTGAFPQQTELTDLAFVLHEGNLPASDWISRTLISFPQLIVGTDKCMLQGKRMPLDIQQIPCIGGDESFWFFRHKHDTESVQINPKIRLMSPEMRLHACLNNMGLAKLPEYVVTKHLVQKRLYRLDLTYAPIAQELSVLYRSRVLPMKTRLFLDFFQTNVTRFTLV